MRVVRDGYGNVANAAGEPIYTNVRFLTDDKKRVAVFTGKAAPVAVFAADDVTLTVTRKPCACKGDPPRMTFQRLWMDADKVNA